MQKAPAIRAFPLPAAFAISGVIFTSAIQALTKSSGENHRPPMRKPMIETTRIAIGIETLDRIEHGVVGVAPDTLPVPSREKKGNPSGTAP